MSTTFTNEGHAEKYLQKLWNKCENEEFCDVVLIVDNEEQRIAAHRSVLSEESEYFHEILTSSLRTTKEVKIPNINGDILQSLVEYCYKGCVVISADIVVELLKTAHKLRLRDVVTACENFMAAQLNASNYLEFGLLAKEYHCELLLQKIKEYCLENYMEISRTADFLQLNVAQLRELLTSDELYVAAEEFVFNSLKTWLEYNTIEREPHKVELLKLVRMPLLERSFLVDNVKPFCTSIECLQAYMAAMEGLLLADSTVPSGGNSATQRRLFQVWMGIASDEYNNKMFIHYYCPQQHKWLKCLKELEYRFVFGRVLMKNCLYIIGGEDAKGITLNTGICLNLSTMTATEIAAMNEHRNRFTAVVLNGSLYVVGGEYEGQISSVERLYPETNKWYKVASMSVNRCNAGVVVLNDKLYVVGGVSNGKSVLTAECYDPIQNVWQSIAPMCEARQLPGVAVANGLLYVVGGYPDIKTAERYDPQTNEWISICSLREKLFPLVSCSTLNNKIVVSFKDRFEEYNAETNEWKVMEPVKHPYNIHRIFLYSGKLLTSKFSEM